MSLTAIVFWLVYAGGALAALARPIVGVLLYVVVYHLNPEGQWWGESVRGLGLRTSLTVALATSIGAITRQPAITFSGRQITAPVAWALAFLALAVASLSWTEVELSRSAELAQKFAKVIAFVLILVTCVRSPAEYQMVVMAWVAGVFYLGYQAWGSVGVYTSGRLTGGLGGSDFADSSGLAAHLVGSLPLVAVLFFLARRWWTRALIAFIGALAINTIILTRTRSAILGLAAVLFVGALSLPRRHRLKGFVAIVLGGALFVRLSDEAWWMRMKTVADYQLDPSATARLTYWKAAVEMASDYPLGVGIGAFHEIVKEYVPGLEMERSAHNTFMTCLAELGVGGLALLFMVLWACVRRQGRMIALSGDGRLEALIRAGPCVTRFHAGLHAAALRAALAGYLACGMFTTRLWAADLWMLIGLSACLASVARGMCREAATAPATVDEPLPAFGGAAG